MSEIIWREKKNHKTQHSKNLNKKTQNFPTQH